ncbi:hypothetical protein GCM10017600_33760 [Streptosporangium carneum]|uniref:Uncharacterized protein n=1 Tax=Streptosporangium carneum TaxID=47481 RepID=A0A9W6MDI9_9ACTN|nr:hypothetical protein GCM10017600_33760 [Streptosporangium carneum]
MAIVPFRNGMIRSPPRRGGAASLDDRGGPRRGTVTGLSAGVGFVGADRDHGSVVAGQPTAEQGNSGGSGETQRDGLTVTVWEEV